MKESPNNNGVPGPGEVLRELRLGLEKQMREGKITPEESQNYFSRIQRELNILALACPSCPCETGSTQARELERRERELRA